MKVKSQPRTKAHPDMQTLSDAPARPERERRAVRFFLTVLLLTCGALAVFWWRNARLDRYSDASARTGTLLEADPALPIRFAKKGDVVTFGRYEHKETEKAGTGSKNAEDYAGSRADQGK